MRDRTNVRVSKKHPGPPKHIKKKKKFYPERGWIQFLILRIIYEKSTHGYQLMEDLESRGFVQPRRLESGAVYTILRRMERRGLVTSKWEKVETGPDRRIYKIADEGVEILRRGLKIIVSRQPLYKDLVNFYTKHFKKQEDTKELDK